jgi:hypothetical protein
MCIQHIISYPCGHVKEIEAELCEYWVDNIVNCVDGCVVNEYNIRGSNARSAAGRSKNRKGKITETTANRSTTGTTREAGRVEGSTTTRYTKSAG